MKFNQLAKLCYGKNQKSVEVKFNSGIPILGTGGIIGYASKPIFNGPSVLIGRKGTINKPIFLDSPFWAIDTIFYTKINEKIILPKYFYYLISCLDFNKLKEGSAVPSLTVKTLNELDLNVHNLLNQQHIVNTIGSVDDLIENYQKRIESIHKLCDLVISNKENWKINNNIHFVKGKEVGSSNYKDQKYKGFIKYIRVGDLSGNKNAVFVSKENKSTLAKEDDILISFDGAPGRIATGLYGYYSSGIRKVESLFEDKGYIYFSLRNKRNQNIIKNHSTGTTILHASNAIEYLEFPIINPTEKEELNLMFLQIIDMQKKINILTNIKCDLLFKYFPTNQ